MRIILPALVALGLIIGSGVVHGLKTDRWGMAGEVTAAAARLDDVPATIGDWTSQEVPVGERQLEGAEAVGHLSRRYINRSDGRAVSVMILCGRPGPISVHPPTVCFTGAGWQLRDEPKKVRIDTADSSTSGRFWSGEFVKSSEGLTTTMRTFWGWSATGAWEAADNPRMTYAPNPLLYKMYVTSEALGGEAPDAETTEDSATVFLRRFLPEVNRALFAKP